MSWLRIDDGFSRHPKVTALAPKERWIWLDLLCYCARYQTGGWLPENIREHCSGATEKLLERFRDLALLDNVEGELRVHDWDVYAPKDPTAAERQAAWRKRHRNENVTEEVTPEVTENVTEESSTSRAGATRVPVLSRPESQNPVTETVVQHPEREQDQRGNGHGAWTTGEDLKPLTAIAPDQDIPF